ncbi:MAG: hypothetical protein LC737_07105, partial [Chloroflexi bacterium]|nr:hypothetical protein [Chloroflexota bacterium]
MLPIPVSFGIGGNLYGYGRARMGGLLVGVGTGIKGISQITLEAASYIRHAQKLLYLTADPLSRRWLHDANPTAENIHRF